MFENNGMSYLNELAKKDIKLPSEDKNEESNEKPEKPEEPKNEMTIIDMTAGINKNTLTQFMGATNPNTEDKKRHRILCRISSPGGMVPVMTTIADMLATAPVPSCIIALGMNASAATIIVSVHNLRLAYSSSTFMIHDMFSINDGSVQDIRNRLEHIEHMRDLFTKLYMDKIGLTKKELERILVRDTYFSALDALNLGTKGLIDGIISKQLDGHKFEVVGRSKTPIVVDLHDDDFNKVVEMLREPSPVTAVA